MAHIKLIGSSYPLIFKNIYHFIVWRKVGTYLCFKHSQVAIIYYYFHGLRLLLINGVGMGNANKFF